MENKKISKITFDKIMKERKAAVPISIRLFRFYFSRIGKLLPGPSIKIASSLFYNPRKKSQNKSELSFLKTADNLFFTEYQSSTKYLDFKKNKLQVSEWGTGEKVILLVHGWESKTVHFLKLIHWFLKQNYKLVIYDAPAHGNSSGVKCDIVDMGDAFEHVLHKIGNVEMVIAHSLGASAVINKLTSNPKISIKKLVLLSPSFDLQDILKRFMSFLKIPQTQKDKMQHYFDVRFEKEIDVFKNRIFTQRGLAESILILHDSDDLYIPFQDTEKIIKKWEKPEFIITNSLGHNKVLKDEKVFKAIDHFLSKETDLLPEPQASAHHS